MAKQQKGDLMATEETKIDFKIDTSAVFEVKDGNDLEPPAVAKAITAFVERKSLPDRDNNEEVQRYIQYLFLYLADAVYKKLAQIIQQNPLAQVDDVDEALREWITESTNLLDSQRLDGTQIRDYLFTMLDRVLANIRKDQ